MAGHRMDRTTEDIHRELTDIFRSLKDPRVAGIISIVRCEVANDLSVAKVYISSVNGLESAKTAVEGLKSASGFIRHELSARLHLRHTPALRFVADDSIAHSADISALLNKLSKQGEEG